MTRDQDGAGSRGVALDDLVSRDDAFLVVGSTKLIGELILANATEVGGRIGGENVLSDDGGRERWTRVQ